MGRGVDPEAVVEDVVDDGRQCSRIRHCDRISERSCQLTRLSSNRDEKGGCTLQAGLELALAMSLASLARLVMRVELHGSYIWRLPTHPKGAASEMLLCRGMGWPNWDG